MNVLYSRKYGIHFRPDSYDLSVAKEVSSYRMLMPREGGTLLDLGGNIGCVSRWWMLSGGARTVAVEPEPENLILLRKNLEQFGNAAVIVPFAAVSDGAPKEISFYLNSGINKGSHTTRPTRGRKEIKVKTCPFSALLATYKPDALKVDIEGGEYQLRENLLSLPSCVRKFAIEWHLNAPKGAREQASEMDKKLRSSGWTCVHGMGSRIMGKNWHITRVYKR